MIDKKVNSRFTKAIAVYIKANNIRSYRSLCTAMAVDYTYFMNIKSGQQGVSISILAAAVSYCRLNANYVLTGQGEKLQVDPILTEILKPNL